TDFHAYPHLTAVKIDCRRSSRDEAKNGSLEAGNPLYWRRIPGARPGARRRALPRAPAETHTMFSPSVVVRRARRGLSVGLVIGAVGVVHAGGPTAGARAARSRLQANAAAPTVAPKALIDQYCVGCHNERLKTGGLVLENRDMSRMGGDADVWE